MGCMEHTCPECDGFLINNHPNVILCPSCGVPMDRDCDEYPDIEEEEE
jgi:hypothetical protein